MRRARPRRSATGGASTSLTVADATVCARRTLSSIKPEHHRSGLRATLAFVSNAAERAPAFSRMDAFALASLEQVVEKVERELVPNLETVAQAFAFMVIYLADINDELEALKAAYWMQRFMDAHGEVAAIRRMRRQMGNAARRPRLSRRRMDSDPFHDAMFDLISDLQKFGVHRSHWASMIEKRRPGGQNLTQTSIRKYLNKHYPKKSET